MPTAPESVYIVPNEFSTDALTRSLRALLPSRHRLIGKHRFTVLDTFDGRIRRAGASLTRDSGDRAPTMRWETTRGSHRLAIRLNQPVSFAWDLPDSPFRQQLTSVVGPRRLLDQAVAEERGSLLEMVDDRDKTVGRLRIACGQARLPAADSGWRPWPTIVTLTGLRGYEEVYERLVPVIASRPGIQPCPEGALGVILRNVGVNEQFSLTSPALVVEPSVRADAGAKQIHLALLDSLIANEPGLRDNLDTEFLHDFRVAVRRARSLLGQIRDVFRPEIVQHFAGEFSWLGRLTGPPRDTDVLVLALRERQRDFSADDMAALMTFLGQVQRQEYAGLVRAMDSDRYRRLLADWRAFLESAESSPAAAHAGGSLATAVSRRAWRLSKRIVKRAKDVDEDTPAAHLHAIRIDAKKLRYLVDIAPAFYAAADFERILDALKRLQRALGDFNDAYVQEKLLLDCGRALCAAGGPPGSVLTLGRLAEQRCQAREQLREEVIETLSGFRAKPVRKACRRAFKKARGGERAR